jgi:murein DD-endopeptidase MepM/ murein hydrolase activator NlpD
MRLRHVLVAPKAAACAAAIAVTLLAAPAALAAGTSDVAAVQIALREGGLYAGAVDGVAGPETAHAIRALQRRAGLTVDGVVGPATRRALGRLGRPALGSRPLRRGALGWDVSRLQFLLASHGCALGPLDGRFGARTEAALLRFQQAAGMAADGVAGPATLRALRRPLETPPYALSAPVPVRPTDGFGPRGARFHTGLDFPAPDGTPVAAAASGRVTYAGWHPGGWGWLVTIAHGRGVRTMYAHLSRIDVGLGQQVMAGATIGLVGSTGRSTGPHLHFEVRMRGASVDPAPALTS